MARRSPVRLVALLLALLLAGCGLLDGPASTTDRPSAAATDPASGLPWVEEADLPAAARDTLALIDAGGPFPYEEDDRTFLNREGLLPERAGGHYREYTVETPRGRPRGPEDRHGRRRGVLLDPDHYASFERIAR